MTKEKSIPSKWEFIADVCRENNAYLCEWYADRIEEVLKELYGNTTATMWRTMYETRWCRMNPSVRDIYNSLVFRVDYCIACSVTLHIAQDLDFEHNVCTRCLFAKISGKCNKGASLFSTFVDSIRERLLI